MSSVIDEQGFRESVGIIIINNKRELFWAKRRGHDSWQFPQGGINKNEIPEEALYRELWEEVGLQSDEVKIISRTDNWLKYHLPKHLVRHNRLPLCIGQKQIWFLLELVADQSSIALDSTGRPEFDEWCWVDYWLPMRRVIPFKKSIYRKALNTFVPIVFPRRGVKLKRK